MGVFRGGGRGTVREGVLCGEYRSILARFLESFSLSAVLGVSHGITWRDTSAMCCMCFWEMTVLESN